MIELMVEGVRELDRELAHLPDKIQRKVMREALRATAGKIRTKLKRGTPRGATGRAARNTKLSVKVTARDAWVRVGYKGGGRGTARIMRLYERGSGPNRKRGGKRLQPARPFFRSAVGVYEPEVLRDLEAALEKALDKNTV